MCLRVVSGAFVKNLKSAAFFFRVRIGVKVTLFTFMCDYLPYPSTPLLVAVLTYHQRKPRRNRCDVTKKEGCHSCESDCTCSEGEPFGGLASSVPGFIDAYEFDEGPNVRMSLTHASTVR